MWLEGLHSITAAWHHSALASDSVHCDICNKRFVGINRKYLLKRHLITHSGEKPFKCPHCDHRANIKQNMDVHIKRKHFDTHVSSNHISDRVASDTNTPVPQREGSVITCINDHASNASENN